MYLYEFNYIKYGTNETIRIVARNWNKALEEFNRFAKQKYVEIDHLQIARVVFDKIRVAK